MSTLARIALGGVLSGLCSGIVMGLISHVGFKIGLFRSSLVIIDGTFALKSLRRENGEARSIAFGIPVHLLTSVSFGLSYAALTHLLNVYPADIWMLVSYTFFLWLSMLFVALPIAGHGLLGKRLGTSTWFEQLILHIIFGGALGYTLHLLSQ